MKSTSTTKHPAVLGEFVPLVALWDEANALFPSETAARWFIRVHRSALIEAQALAYDLGRYIVHPARMAQLRERIALAAAARKLASSSDRERAA